MGKKRDGKGERERARKRRRGGEEVKERPRQGTMNKTSDPNKTSGVYPVPKRTDRLDGFFCKSEIFSNHF